MDAPTSLHPTDQTLHAYGLGKLDDASAESVNSHLEGCPDCRRRTAEMSSDSFLGRLRGGRPTDGLERPAPAGPAGPPPVDTLPPELADHKEYEVVRELGRGGMGVVYLVRNRLMGRNEVLKVMGRHLVERPEVSERFLREIRAVASLRHPNIVAAHHAFHVGGSIAFTMEYVDGYDLSKMVKTRGPLPVAHACLFAHQAAQGLQHAHEEGMVHRDIKPGNLMVSRRGEKAVVKILDFGLAKAAREGQFDSALTHAGQMLGTPDFIAPEQSVDAQKADIRADIYSLGCTLYYLLTGGPPFRAMSLYDLLQAHHSIDAKLLNFVRPEVPTELAALVAKMMAKEPERRFRTPAEVSGALGPFYKKGNAALIPAKPDVSRVAPPEIRRPAPTTKPIPTDPTPASSPTPASPMPTKSPRPEAMWASLIDFREPEPPAENMIPKLAPDGPTRRPRWKSWPAIAAASLLGFIALGIVIYISIDKNGVKAIVSTDNASPKKEGKGNGQVSDLTDGLPTGSVTTNADAVQFAPLFNGKNLDGWKHLLPNGSEWVVIDGMLEGRAVNKPGGAAVLLTDRSNFKNFRLRVRFRYERNGTGVIELRRTPTINTKSGYVVQHGSWPNSGSKLVPVGSITKITDHTYGEAGASWEQVAQDASAPTGSWNTLEITVFDEKISTSLNGKPVCSYADTTTTYRSGAIALTCNAGSTVQFREVAIEELTGQAVGGAGGPPTSVGSGPDALVGKPPVPPPDAEKPSPPKSRTNSIGMNLVLIPAGEFMMGSPEDDKDAKDDEKPRHRVTITKPFYLGRSEVTRGQFRRFVDEEGYRTEAEEDGKGGFGWNEDTRKFEGNSKFTWKNPGFEQTDEHPVVNVSWNDAVAFTRWLSRKEGKTYRLPTEAEWEYACRARSTSRYSFGDDPEALVRAGNVVDATARQKNPEWTRAISARDGYVYTSPVGRFNANAFGLYDMHGNVLEWCSDWYDAGYYKTLPATDPLGARETRSRVFRGGAWNSGPIGPGALARSAARRFSAPNARGSDVGFRVTLNVGDEVRALSGVAPHDSSRPTAEQSRAAEDVASKAAPSQYVPKGDWHALFNGTDTSGWVVDERRRCTWGVEGDALVGRAPKDRPGLSYMLSQRDYTDFSLRFEFRVALHTDSGLVLRAVPGEEPYHMEISLRSAPYERDPSGSLGWENQTGFPKFSYPNPEPIPKPPGTWNRIEVESRGDTLSVSVNGERATSWDLGKLAAQPTGLPGLKRRSGRIGFQSVTGVASFRNIEIRELAPGPAGGSGGPLMIGAKPQTALVGKPPVPPAADGLPAKSSSTFPIDLLRPGTVWKGHRTYRKGWWEGNTVEYELHVRERDGLKFKGHKFDNGPRRNRVEVEGEVDGAGIVWREIGTGSFITTRGKMMDKALQIDFRGVRNGETVVVGDGRLVLESQ